MRKISNADELRTELRRVLAYAHSPRPSRNHIATELQRLSTRTAADEIAYFRELENLQARFVGRIGRDLADLAERLFERAKNLLKILFTSWDYGTARLPGDGTGTIRVWNKDTSFVTTKSGEQIVGNLLVEVRFEPARVHVTLVHENRTTLLDQAYPAGPNCTPYTIAWDCNEAFKKLLLGG